MEHLKKSPWMLHYDASSCNGCDIEVLACTMPRFDIERFGIINTGNPFHPNTAKRSMAETIAAGV